MYHGGKLQGPHPPNLSLQLLLPLQEKAREGSQCLVLPTEIREYIFKLVVTSHPEDDRYQIPNTTPAMTSVCRLVRQEMLQLFFKHNHFVTPTTDESSEIAIKDPVKWLYGMRPYLAETHQITFFVMNLAIDGDPYLGDISVTIKHDPAQGCWTTTCEDDWSIENEWKLTLDQRNALERDGEMLCDLMRAMVDGRSRADLSPEYLMWLARDAAAWYATEKVEGKSDHAQSQRIFYSMSIIKPGVMRPPDMYSTDLEYDHKVW